MAGKCPSFKVRPTVKYLQKTIVTVTVVTDQHHRR